DELPAHVRGSRHPVHLDHVVLPLDALRRVVRVLGLGVMVLVTVVMVLVVFMAAVVLMVLMAVIAASNRDARREKLHTALRTAVGLIASYLGMHRADVGHRPAFGRAEVHLGDERQRLVGRRLEERIDALPYLDHVAVDA